MLRGNATRARLLQGRGPVAEVMSLPEDVRLEHALDLLRMVTGDEAPVLSAIIQRFNIPVGPARIYAALNRAGGEPVSLEVLMACLGSEAAKPDVAVWICIRKLRRAGVKITTHYNLGYSLSEPEDIKPIAVRQRWRARMGEPWTTEEDSELLRMKANGSCVDAIAEELDRSSRAVSGRLSWLKRAGAV
jgi:biotin operon repressor